MEIIINSIKKAFFAAIVFVINIPVFWSLTGFMDFVKNAVSLLSA